MTRRLAVGGTHIFDESATCRIENIQPDGIAKDLHWDGTLAVEALREGSARVMCAEEGIDVEFVLPARLEIESTGDRPPLVSERFHVRARLHDRAGNELEVGKFTDFNWTAGAGVEAAPDPSAGEFGQCDTCFGMYTFRALRPGPATLEARCGGVSGTLRLSVGP